MAERNVEGQHLCTVEDPVEARMPGIAQVQVHERAGLTFAVAVRSFLRQDPNVIMVGEMRDPETASVAVSAALSGQLVLTTLHASDAPRAIDRLVELGLKRHALASALSAVVAQRLVRRLCPHCAKPAKLSRAEAEMLALPCGSSVREAVGCLMCEGTGYRGRTAIFEMLRVRSEISEAIACATPAASILGLASRDGFESMACDGISRVLAGETSVSELRRILALGVDA